MYLCPTLLSRNSLSFSLSLGFLGVPNLRPFTLSHTSLNFFRTPITFLPFSFVSNSSSLCSFSTSFALIFPSPNCLQLTLFLLAFFSSLRLPNWFMAGSEIPSMNFPNVSPRFLLLPLFQIYRVLTRARFLCLSTMLQVPDIIVIVISGAHRTTSVTSINRAFQAASFVFFYLSFQARIFQVFHVLTLSRFILPKFHPCSCSQSLLYLSQIFQVSTLSVPLLDILPVRTFFLFLFLMNLPKAQFSQLPQSLKFFKIHLCLSFFFSLCLCLSVIELYRRKGQDRD